MKQSVLLCLCFSLLVALPACEKHATTQPSDAGAAASPHPAKDREAKFNACSLITKEEVEAVQGSPVRDTMNSGRMGADAENSQCFYTAAEFSKSINLVAVRVDSASASGRGPKDIWRQM